MSQKEFQRMKVIAGGRHGRTEIDHQRVKDLLNDLGAACPNCVGKRTGAIPIQPSSGGSAFTHRFGAFPTEKERNA